MPELCGVGAPAGLPAHNPAGSAPTRSGSPQGTPARLTSKACRFALWT
jgi:hypothetical protein